MCGRVIDSPLRNEKLKTFVVELKLTFENCHHYGFLSQLSKSQSWQGKRVNFQWRVQLWLSNDHTSLFLSSIVDHLNCTFLLTLKTNHLKPFVIIQMILAATNCGQHCPTTNIQLQLFKLCFSIFFQSIIVKQMFSSCGVSIETAYKGSSCKINSTVRAQSE